MSHTGKFRKFQKLRGRISRIASPLVRFFAWWAGMFVFLGGASATCPFCGQAGCPGGAAGAGILASIFAAALVIPKYLVRLCRRILG